MLDFELAEIYGYETKNFNRQVKNNNEKFEGDDFMFELNDEEVENLSRCKNFTLNRGTGRGSNIKYNLLPSNCVNLIYESFLTYDHNFIFTFHRCWPHFLQASKLFQPYLCHKHISFLWLHWFNLRQVFFWYCFYFNLSTFRLLYSGAVFSLSLLTTIRSWKFLMHVLSIML